MPKLKEIVNQPEGRRLEFKEDKIELSWKEPGIAFRVTFVNKNYRQPGKSQPELKQELQPEFKEELSALGTKLGLRWDQVGTKSGPSRDQAGTKLALSRRQVGVKSGPSWDQVIQILDFCMRPKSVQRMMKQIKWSNRTKFRNKFINPLLDTAFIQMTIPDKPNSSKQQYQITERGEAFLQFMSQNSKDL